MSSLSLLLLATIYSFPMVKFSIKVVYIKIIKCKWNGKHFQFSFFIDWIIVSRKIFFCLLLKVMSFYDHFYIHEQNYFFFYLKVRKKENTNNNKTFFYKNVIYSLNHKMKILEKAKKKTFHLKGISKCVKVNVMWKMKFLAFFCGYKFFFFEELHSSIHYFPLYIREYLNWNCNFEYFCFHSHKTKNLLNIACGIFLDQSISDYLLSQQTIFFVA